MKTLTCGASGSIDINQLGHVSYHYILFYFDIFC